MASLCADNYDKLVELSNICGHISAQKSLTTEWCAAIQELCHSNISRNDFMDLIREIDVSYHNYGIVFFTFIVICQTGWHCCLPFFRFSLIKPFLTFLIAIHANLLQYKLSPKFKPIYFLFSGEQPLYSLFNFNFCDITCVQILLFYAFSHMQAA